MSNLKKILIDKKNCKSLWFMRQAGRYLPEFREIRSKNQNFIDLCLNSELSSEITLQPINRFDIDSAINKLSLVSHDNMDSSAVTVLSTAPKGYLNDEMKEFTIMLFVMAGFMMSILIAATLNIFQRSD